MKTKYKFSAAFTIVELAIVIVVIGVLVGLTAMSYGKWQETLAKDTVQSDLRVAAAAMENAKNFSSGYPEELINSYKQSEHSNISFIWGDETEFCIRGISTRYSSIVYYINTQVGKDPVAGNCPARVSDPPGTPVIALASAATTSLSVTWGSVVNATSYTVRYGTASPSTVASCSTSPCTISGLTSNTSYKVNVTASNGSVTSASNVLTASTAAVTPPPAPTNLAGYVSGSGAYDAYSDYSIVTITWTSASQSLVSHYEVSGCNVATVTNNFSSSKSCSSEQITYSYQTYGALTRTFSVRAVAPDGTTKSNWVSVTIQYN